MVADPIAADLDDIVRRAAADLDGVRGARILVTGGTGFIGKWMVASIAAANVRLGLSADAVVLTRSPQRFLQRHPSFASLLGVTYIEGDVRALPDIPGRITHVVHAATDVSDVGAAADRWKTFETCVKGTEQVCELAARKGVEAVLLTSSGAVYGPQPADLDRMPETYPGGPDPLRPGSAYAEGKRAAEWMLCESARLHGYRAKVARIYALAGPYLPDDGPFAIGNFIRDALAGRDIRISGDGRPLRSYLYASDLVVWLLAVLMRGGGATAYNVGAEEAVSIRDLAEAVRDALSPGAQVQTLSAPGPGAAPRYVPSTLRIRTELGVAPTVGLHEAILRTAASYRAGAGAHVDGASPGLLPHRT